MLGNEGKNVILHRLAFFFYQKEKRFEHEILKINTNII
jgi:hypothetical protein